MRHRRVLAREGQILFLESDMDSPLGKPKNNLPQIVQITGQPIHGVADHRIPFSDVAGKLFELRAMEVLARSLVYETLIERDLLKLAQLLLV